MLAYLKRNHLALLCLVLIMTGGTAYAAKVHVPKNAVASKQVKNGSLTGQDIKDGTVAGADLADGSVGGADLTDGDVTGADLKDGSIGAKDLAPGAVPETQMLDVSVPVGGGPVVVYSDPLVGTIGFTCTASKNWQITAVGPGTATPGQARVVGHDIVDASPTGSFSSRQLTAGLPTNTTSFSTTDSLLAQGNVTFDMASRLAFLTWDVDGSGPCVLRGLLTVLRK
jgi:hypothetical protein